MIMNALDSVVSASDVYEYYRRMFLENLPVGSEIIRVHDGKIMYKIADGEHNIYVHWRYSADLLNSLNMNYNEFTCREFSDYIKSPAYRAARFMLS